MGARNPIQIKTGPSAHGQEKAHMANMPEHRTPDEGLTAANPSRKRRKMMDAGDRVVHKTHGCGFVTETKTTEAGNAAVLVKFDYGEERMILAAFLEPSNDKAPAAAPKPKKKTSAHKTDPVVEPISDKLLVPELDDAPTSESESDSEDTQPLAM